MIRNGVRALRTARPVVRRGLVAASPSLLARQLAPQSQPRYAYTTSATTSATQAAAKDPSNPNNLLTPEECESVLYNPALVILVPLLTLHTPPPSPPPLLTLPTSLTAGEALLTAPGSPYELEIREVNGRNLKVWKHTPHDFATFIRGNMERWSTNEFLSTPIAAPEPFEARESVTFGEAYDQAASIAALLRERGIGVGDRVAIGGVNSAGWVVSCLGVQLLGAVPVLLNNGLVGDSQAHCLKLTKPKIVLVDDKLAAMIGTEKIEGVGPVWCWGPTAHLSKEVQAAVTEIASMSPRPETVASVKAGEGLESLGPESDSIVFFTSGTTSLPKAVLVTQQQALHIIHSSTYQNARTTLRLGAPVQDALKAYDPKPEGVAMLSIPLFHVQGMLTWLMVALHNGSKLVFLRHWSVPTAVKLMVEHKVGRIGGVPAIPAAILASPDLPADFELASTTYGGATPPSDLAQRLVQRWPKMQPGTGWGMTETSAFHTGFNGQEYLAKPHGAGQALPVTEIKVVDPKTKKDLPAGEVGLLLARGQNIMKEYVDNPKATAETIDADGWLDTGDLAFIDKFGDLHMSDRVKDIIIRGGENIPSAEVERVLLEDPRIAEASAVSVPCDIMGERVGAAVSLAPGVNKDEATPLSIVQTAWPKLRYCARPDIVMVLDQLPWNPSQKVLKGEVKKILGAEWERVERKPLVNSRDATARQ
ncbi:uncharacterized protein CcaverHIS019_0701320 [Cutaneotrichosporon cavernicola]|uniref:Acetyl-CoA synthetase-like protein n=1 Tax=Cutaneotrichosporon cavernicola TaxID=279322 RepID=A0AA48QYR7_9TREE|nr:uncharacterized protein CcaverHIS019_0701320 [Cutaneotrichosporon cavernicola]BEI94560.1 hypothetical protein CcaverHIS019_0701320 [Cutaneotrichosporon cavernicola]